MKTLLITLEYPPQVGGVANYLADLTDSETMVLVPHHYWLFLLFSVRKLIRKEKSAQGGPTQGGFEPASGGIEKIEVGQVLPIGTVALYFKKRFNIPYRLYTYGMDVTFARRKPKLLKKILDNAEEIITISNFTKQKLLAAGADEKKIKIIEPQAHITPDKFKVSDEEIKEFKNKYNLNNKKVILTVGRLVSRKGQDTIIQCLPKMPEVIYLIVGKGNDRTRLERLAKDNKVEDRVIFTGELTDKEIAICYTVCDVFVMVTREQGDDFEGYGIVYKEAQSFGKPIVAGKSGGTVEAVGNQGILVEPKDKEEIIKALISFLK